MKKTFLLFLLIAANIYSQEVKFAWISNISDITNNSVMMDSLINSVNEDEDIKFLVLDGNLTKDATLNEFESLNEQLNRIDKKYFLLPSSDDLSENGLLNFREYWFDLNFNYSQPGLEFIGVTSESFLKNNKRYFTPETVSWLNTIKHDSSTQVILFFSGDIFNDNINTSEILLSFYWNKKIVLLSSDTEQGNIYDLQTAGYSKEKKKFSFKVCEIKDDTLSIVSPWNSKKNNDREQILIKEKNLRFVAQSTEEESATTPVFKKDFSATCTAPPIIYDDKIFVCLRNGVITALDSLGNKIWEYNSYGDIISKPVVADDKFVAATRQGDLITLDVNTGQSIQTIGFEDFITSDLLAIEYKGDKQLFIPKQSDSKTAVVFGTASGKVYCYDLETLQEYWSNSDSKGYIYSSLEFTENKIICKTLEGNISCLDAKRGWLIWRWNEKTKTDKTNYKYSLVIRDRMVFAASTSGYVYGIDLLLGKMKWQSDKFRECNSINLTSDESKLLVKVYDEKLILVSQTNGTNLNVIKYSGSYDNAFGRIFHYNKNIYATSGEGNIFRISNFKKSEKVFSLTNELLLDVIHYKDDLFLVSTIDGRIIMTKFE